MKAVLLLPILLLPSGPENATRVPPMRVAIRQIQLPDPIPCITQEEWRATRIQTEWNLLWLRAQGRLPPRAPAGSVSFRWPMRAAAGLDDFSFYVTSSFPDHDQDQPGGIRDYECGIRTYDGHNGSDSVLWPFWWYKVDHDQVEVIAAAGGTIINRADGFDDRSCTPGGSSNKVAVRHADGTMAWYLHLKKNSVTPKPVGALVQAGEQLGIVASSGNSGLPHLHFDVRDSNWNSFDPLLGGCNKLPGGSWWQEQKPYHDSFINAVRTHSSPPVFPPCPQTEIPNFEDHFSPGETVHIGIYHRDLLLGHTARYQVLDPTGVVALHGSYAMSAPHYAASYALPSLPLPASAPFGTWRISVEYEGMLFQRSFVVEPPTLRTSR